MQDKIMLVYRSEPMSYWDHRHLYLGPKYSAKTEYNHRSMLDNEIEIHPNGALQNKPWGQKEFALLDPDSNLLTFGQSVAE